MSSQSPTGAPPETPSAPTHEIGRGVAPARENTTPGTPSRDDARSLDFLGRVHIEAGERHESSARGPARAGCMADVARSAYWRPAAVRRDGGKGLNSERDPTREPMTHSTRTLCARLSRWTGRRSPGHCARSGCGPSADPRARWPPPPISICGRGRPRWTPGTRHGSAGAGWCGPSRRLRAARTSASPRPSGRATLSIAR